MCWTLLAAGPESTGQRSVLVVFLRRERGHLAPREGEHEWHLVILFPHLHHLEVLILRLLLRAEPHPKMIPAMLAA